MDNPVTVPAWMDDANCLNTDPEIFHVDKGRNPSDAKRVCARCIVTADCLAFAVNANERYGIYGGLTGYERRRYANGRGIT